MPLKQKHIEEALYHGLQSIFDLKNEDQEFYGNIELLDTVLSQYPAIVERINDEEYHLDHIISYALSLCHNSNDPSSLYTLMKHNINFNKHDVYRDTPFHEAVETIND